MSLIGVIGGDGWQRGHPSSVGIMKIVPPHICFQDKRYSS